MRVTEGDRRVSGFAGYEKAAALATLVSVQEPGGAKHPPEKLRTTTLGNNVI